MTYRSYSTENTPPQSYQSAEEVTKKAMDLWARLEFNAAISLVQSYLSRPKSTSIPQHIPILEDSSVYVNLGTLLMSHGRYEEAARTYRILVDASLVQLDRWDGALKKLEEDLQRNPTVPGRHDDREDSVERLATARKEFRVMVGLYHHDLGRALEFLGDPLETQSAYEKSVEMLEMMDPKDLRLLGTVHANISMLYENMGNYKVAKNYHVTSMRMNPMLDRYDHPHVATMLHHSHLLKDSDQERKRLEDILDKGSPDWREKYTKPKSDEEIIKELIPDHNHTQPPPPSQNPSLEPEFETESVLSSPEKELSLAVNSTQDQLDYLSETSLQNQIPKTEHEANIQLATLLSKATQEDVFNLLRSEAEEQAAVVRQMLLLHRQQCAPSAVSAASPPAPSTPTRLALVPLLLELAVYERKLENYDESLGLVDEALGIVKELKGEVHCAYATALMHKCLHYFTRRQWTEAEVIARQALAIKEQLLPVDHLHVGLILYDLGVILGRRDLHKESIHSLNTANAIFQQHLFADHPYSRITANTTAKADFLMRKQAAYESQSRLRGFKPEL